MVYLLLVGLSFVFFSASGEHDLNVITCSLTFGFLSLPSLLLAVDFLPARSVNGPVDGYRLLFIPPPLDGRPLIFIFGLNGVRGVPGLASSFESV